jgi:hypothetical protein
MCNHSYSNIHIILMSLVIIGSINYGANMIGYNLIEILSYQLNNLFKTNIPINNIIYFIIVLAGIILASKRSTWLPFLGKAVFPGSLIPLKKPILSDITIPIKTLPNVKIAYWAALNKGEKTNVKLAYGSFENSGVVMSDINGNATLPIMTGTGYTIPSGMVIPRHIHYRIIDYPGFNGMMGKINTIQY